jgi:hypothetical protein
VGSGREQWVDSTVLAEALRRGLPFGMERCSPVARPEAAIEWARVVAVYLFELRTKDALLFDGADQVALQGDAIFALQTQAPPLPTKDACGPAAVMINSADASCEVMQEVFRVAWGSIPLSVLKDPHTTRLAFDYTWTRRPCDSTMAFFHRDAPARSELFRRRGAIVASVASVLGRFVSVGVEVATALSPASKQEVGHLEALLSAALEQSSRYMALHSHAQARDHVEKAEGHSLALARALSTALDCCLAQHVAQGTDIGRLAR